MASEDNASDINWVGVEWSANLTHVHFYTAESGGTRIRAVAKAVTVNDGDTVTIDAGELTVMLDPASGVADSFTATMLAQLNATDGVELWVGWGTSATSEVSDTGYDRKQPALS